MRLRTTLAAVLLAGGCISADQDLKLAAAREEAGVRPFPGRMSMAESRAFFIGATRLVSAADKGSQLSYMAPDGSVHLWFPGNARIVRGRWALESAGSYVQVLGRPVDAVKVCFTYEPDSFNAWTGERGQKTCMPADALKRLTQDRAEGDIFGLATTAAVPFVLQPSRTSIAALKARLR